MMVYLVDRESGAMKRVLGGLVGGLVPRDVVYPIRRAL